MSRIQTATRASAVPATALAVALASAALALAVQASAEVQAGPAPGGVAYVHSDAGLPGEGRPPSPGPTDPDGPM
jgi:hypothetical protein